MYKTLTIALRASENRPASLRSSNGFPLARFAGLLHGKASHEIFGCLAAPCKFRSLATPQAGAEQPVLIVVLLMKGLLFRALLSHHTVGGEGGAVRHQRGESHRRWLIDVMLFMTYDTER